MDTNGEGRGGGGDPTRRSRARRRARFGAAVAATGIAYALGSVAWLTAVGPIDTVVGGLRVSLASVRAPVQVACVAVALALAIAWATAEPRIAAVAARLRAGIARRPFAVGAGLCVAASAVCSALALTRYGLVQSGALDHGAFANIVWNGFAGNGLVSSIQHRAYLGDHFAPILYVVGWLYALWPDAGALLVVQGLAVGLSAWAVFHFARVELRDEALALLLALVFLTNPYLHRVNRFDFHTIALALPIFLWMGCAVHERRWPALAMLATAAALTKETAMLVLIGVGALLCAHAGTRRVGAIVSVASMAWLLIVVEALIPHFRGEAYSYVDRYGLPGTSPLGLAGSALTHPGAILGPIVAPERLRSVAGLFGAWAFLPLAGGAWLLPTALPILANLSSHHAPQWRFADHYAAEALPFLALAAVVGTGRLLRCFERRWRAEAVRAAVYVALGLFVLWNAAGMPSYFSLAHGAERRAAVRALVATVPPGASVCAQDQVVAHLALRRQVELLSPGAAHGRCAEADVIVLDPLGTHWPFASDTEYQRTIDELMAAAGRRVETHGPLTALIRP